MLKSILKITYVLLSLSTSAMFKEQHLKTMFGKEACCEDIESASLRRSSLPEKRVHGRVRM